MAICRKTPNTMRPRRCRASTRGRIKELETLLALADVIDVSKLNGSTVKFGATVKFIDEGTETERTYMIVGDQEADASAGRISISSPIAKAMIGKEAGDSFEVAAPAAPRATRSSKSATPEGRSGRPLPPRDRRAVCLPQRLADGQMLNRRDFYVGSPYLL